MVMLLGTLEGRKSEPRGESLAVFAARAAVIDAGLKI
jgi:hypothetical protein